MGEGSPSVADNDIDNEWEVVSAGTEKLVPLPCSPP
jgi:hypothetical protein